MKSLLCIGLALGLIVIASSLTCKKCDFRALGICFNDGGTQSCNKSCFNLKAKLGSVSFFSKQGCEENCIATANGTDNIFKFQYDKTCCETDLCNSGNSVKISLSLGLGIGLLWLLNAV